MNGNPSLPKYTQGGIAKPLYVGGDNQKEVILREDELLKAIEKELQEGKGILCDLTFDELRGLK